MKNCKTFRFFFLKILRFLTVVFWSFWTIWIFLLANCTDGFFFFKNFKTFRFFFKFWTHRLQHKLSYVIHIWCFTTFTFFTYNVQPRLKVLWSHIVTTCTHDPGPATDFLSQRSHHFENLVILFSNHQLNLWWYNWV